MEFELIYALAGLGVGFAIGLVGVGGGSLMTPLLYLGFGVPIATAVGTDLLYACVTKAAGAYAHARAATVNWRLVGLLAAGSLPAAVATVAAVRWLDLRGEGFDRLILNTLSIAVLFTAVLLLLKGWLQRLLGRMRLPACLGLPWCRDCLTVVGGGAVGVLVTLSSVGAGVLGTSLVLLLYPGLGVAAVVGSELAHAVPLTFIAGIGHLGLGTVDVSLLLSLLSGSVPGAYVGARIGSRLSERVLRPALATMLMYIGVRLGFA